MYKHICILLAVLCASIALAIAEVPEEISEKLNSDNQGERLDACLMLGRLGGEESVVILKEQFRDRSMLVRHGAANALARIGGPGVNNIFEEMIKTGGSEARRLGLAGLAMTGDPESIELVMVQLDDPDWQVRWSAVYALGQWGYRPAIPKLKEIAENDQYLNSATGEYPVRKSAAQMCDRIMSSIEWYRNFDNAVSLSRKLNRPVWVYWFVENSEWCTKLEEGVFYSSEISDISQNFVCVKLDVETDGSLASQYEVGGAPFNLILDNQGGELDRILGYIGKDELVKRLKNALENKGTPQEWKKNLSKDPSDIHSSWYLAEWYMDTGQINKAIPLLENVIRCDKKNQSGYTDNAMFVLGYAYGALGEYKKGADVLDALVGYYPRFIERDKALYCLALDYLSMNKIDQAKERFNELLVDYPESQVTKPTKEILKKL